MPDRVAHFTGSQQSPKIPQIQLLLTRMIAKTETGLNHK